MSRVSRLYVVRTNPALGPVFKSGWGTKISERVLPVYPTLSQQEVENRQRGVTHQVIRPLVRSTSLVEIPPDQVSPQLLRDWQDQIDQIRRYPGWTGRKIKIASIYLK